MKKYIILIGLLVGSVVLRGQGIEEKLIFTDNTKDSMYINANLYFDRAGNYCFVTEKNDKGYLVTNTDTIIGPIFNAYDSGLDGYVNKGKKAKNEPFYYKNDDGIKIYGKIRGEIKNYQTSKTTENIGLMTIFKDSVYYYINDKLIYKKHKEPKVCYCDVDWVAFSENGNVIYHLEKGDMDYLYVNYKQIDSSENRYRLLTINDNGDYMYGKYVKLNGKYMFSIHRKDTAFICDDICNDYVLKNNGTYYYVDDFKEGYIIINNDFKENIKDISNIILIDKNTYLYTFKKNGQNKINVNGKTYSLNYEKIFYPSVDTQGNFALYGIRNYYLYKYVNGKEITAPISKYGVRAVPLYISPTGQSIHYFKTDDSLYLYKDDSLIFPLISNSEKFLIIPYNDFLFKTEEKNGNSLFYLEYKDKGYLVYNGVFSKPISLLKIQESFRADVGNIVTGTLTNDGFFIIQKIDNQKYLIVVNNKIYKELDNVDEILYGNSFFDKNGLIFYGIKGKSYYQFKLNL